MILTFTPHQVLRKLVKIRNNEVEQTILNSAIAGTPSVEKASNFALRFVQIVDLIYLEKIISQLMNRNQIDVEGKCLSS